MKSIRVSLIVYFLLLLAVALGAVSILVYRNTSQAFQANQETNRELLRTQYEERRRKESQDLDSELLRQARTLASLAQSQFEANRLYPLFYTQLGTLTSAVSPHGHVTMPLWFAETGYGPLWFQISRNAGTNIQLNEELLHRDDDNATDYFQINSQLGRAWRSRSLEDKSLPFDRVRFRNMQVLHWDFDTIEFDGKTLRRVLLRAPVSKYQFVPPTKGFPAIEPRRRDGGMRAGPTSRPLQGPPPGPLPVTASSQTSSTPTFYIQCATATVHLDKILSDLEADHGRRLVELEDEARTALQRLRFRLLAIALMTFAAICLGGSLLIGYGLMPLRRLSDAVSRVTEKDFHLHVDGPAPPRELEPIIERLQQTLEQLRQAFEREKQATADISHELRTPLAGLLTTLEVTLRKARSTEEYRTTLADCRELVKQMTQLVERLLALTRLDARTDRLRVEQVDAVAVAEQCAALVRPLARANGQSLSLHADGPVDLATDSNKLREVIANLMHNAVEYNRPDGTVDVYLRAVNGGLDLEVRDTGIGIAPEHRERIFERFFRADPSRHAESMHAGLGLAIVRGYVDLMGGKITVDSETGRGSSFHVVLPSLQLEPQHEKTGPMPVRVGA